MKKLIARIKAILRNRRTRQLWTRTVSSIACLVIFVTTYALVLPAITMESEAACGLEAHQHDDSCYEERLTCSIPESDGHLHTEDCYSTVKKLVCGCMEHTHTSDCFDENGDLMCGMAEHQHKSKCYEMEESLTCTIPESNGHHHDASCYEKVLICGKQIHVHSTACYGEDAASAAATEGAAVAATGAAGSTADSAEASESASDMDVYGGKGFSGAGNTAASAAASQEIRETGFVPTLDALDFAQLLNRETGIYYHHVDPAAADVNEGAGSSAVIYDWEKVKDDTVLGENDFLRVYLAYSIPAGSLNTTNEAARYRLPANLHLTEEQIAAINGTENGIAKTFIDYTTLSVTDPDKYHKYLGIEAVEGTRRPDRQPARDEQNVQEYISAAVQAQNVYDEDGAYGEKGAYLGQDLIFTFSPYTIAKNRNEYDTNGQPTKAGETVEGWLTLDLRVGQVDFIENRAKIVFAEGDEYLSDGVTGGAGHSRAIREISTELSMQQKAEDTEADHADEREYPAITFDDSIVVEDGRLSTDIGADEKNSAGHVSSATRTELKVHVEAGEGTFPSGTQMRLGAVRDKDMDAVSQTLEDTVEGKTRGFHAVDITFLNPEGEEIEPLKPIRVSMTSDAIREAVEDSSTAPLVVHIEGLDGQAASENSSDEAGEKRVGAQEAAQGTDAQGDGRDHEKTGETQENEEGSDEKQDGLKATVIEAESGAVAVPAEGKGRTDTSAGSAIGTDTLSFEAESFSVYAIVYTVDFHWMVDGKEFTYSIQGGSVIGLKELLPLMKVIVDDPETSENEVMNFVDDIQDVSFTNEDLVRIAKIEMDTTVGELEAALGVMPAYSGEITAEDIAVAESRSLKAKDWVLISLRPFTSEETMTIRLANGEEFTIRVTDAGEASIQDLKPSQLQTLKTEDTRKKGIKMWLFDYDLDHTLDNENNKANTTGYVNDGINSQSDLKFLGWGAGNKEKKYTDDGNGGFGINDFTGLDQMGSWNWNHTEYSPEGNFIRALQGIVSNELDGGYPALQDGTSLAYLFDPTAATEDRKVYGGTTKESGNVTGLFELKNGYYIYDSDEHYAELGTDEKNFKVYTTTLSQTNNDGTTHNPKRAVGFFPFDTYAHVYNDLKYENDGSKYGNNGTLYLNPDNRITNKNTLPQQTNPGPSGLNHHLGVAMEMDFIIPKGGKTDDGKPIEFNFSGDDDMWVFIDDQLVLDIGGLHQPVDGTINFATGTATITGKKTQNGHNDNTGNAAIATVKGVTDNRGNDFHFYPALDMPDGGDNQVHTMRIFYLERGGCDSNCMISFNLPLVNAKGSVTIAKCEATEDGSKPTKKLKGVRFGVYKTGDCSGNPVMEVYSDENGLIDFFNLGIEDPATSRYYLKELEPLPGYKQNTEVYTLVPDQKLDEATYVFKVLNGKGTEVQTIGEEPQIYPAILNEKEKTDLKVKKIWEDEDGKTVSGPTGAAITVTLMRYKLVKDKVESPKGTLKIQQSLSGDISGKQYFTVDYTVRKDGQVIRTGSYTGTDGAEVKDLEPGDYVVEAVCKSTNASYSVKEASQRSDKVHVDGNGTAAVSFANELKKLSTGNRKYKVTIHAEDSKQGSKEFTYYEGTEVSLIFDYTGETWIKNKKPYEGGGYGVSIKIDQKDKGLVFNDSRNKKIFTFTVNKDVDIELTNTGYSNWDNVVNKCMSLSPADVNNRTKAPAGGRLKAGKADEEQDNTVQVTVNNTAATPQAPNGFTVDTEADDIKNWKKEVSLPDGENWESIVSNLDKYDKDGNPYVYYMASVTESGVPNGTVAVITTDGSNKQVIRSDSTAELKDKVLSLTDRVPAVKTFSADKSWKNADGSPAVPPVGAKVTFMLFADGESTGRFVDLNGKKDVRTVNDPLTEEKNEEALVAQAYENECWNAFWTDLPKYRSTSGGGKVEIVYSVKEVITYPGYVPESAEVKTNGGTIVNKKVQGPDDVIPEPDNTNPEIHKRIDALRDGAVNPDSPHTGEDLTDLYRLYLDYKINSIQDPKGVDLLFLLDHSGSMNFSEFSGNPNRAPTMEKVLNGSSGLITEFMNMNEKNRWAAVGFYGPHGFDYELNYLEFILSNFVALSPGPYAPGDELANDVKVAERDSEVLSPGGTSYTWSQQKGDGVNIQLDPETGTHYFGVWPFGRTVYDGSTVLTNYTAGFWRAEQFLLNPSEPAHKDGRKKVVVFISDGIPTLYIDSQGSIKNANTRPGSSYYPDNNGNGGCPAQTLEQFRAFTKDLKDYGYEFGKDLELFTVGFGDSLVASTEGNALLNSMIREAYGNNPEGHFIGIKDGEINSTAQKMKQALGTIIGTKETFTNLKIEDRLTGYVDLVGLEDSGGDSKKVLDAAKTRVTMTNPENPSDKLILYDFGEEGGITEDGKKVLESVSYDSDTKKVTVTFKPDYKPLPGVTYTLSFDVKATEKAYKEYVTEGYNQVGEEDTDYLETRPDPNATSVDKPGFRSNVQAIASYKHNGTDEIKNYKHPVIQAQARIHVVKIDQEERPLEGAKFALYNENYSPAATEEVNRRFLIKGKESLESKKKDTDPAAEAVIFDGKLQPGTYWLVETGTPDGYNSLEGPIKIVVTENNTTHKVSLKATMNGKDIEAEHFKLDTKTYAWTLKVMNTAGVELPSTGGPGTDIFYIVGSLLILMTTVMFVGDYCHHTMKKGRRDRCHRRD